MYDSNLGDQAIYYSTKSMLESILKKKNQKVELRNIDIYGRKTEDHPQGKDSFLHRVSRKLFGKFYVRYEKKKICRSVADVCNTVIDDGTVGAVFVGGGLLKSKGQDLDEQIIIVLKFLESRNVPVIFLGVGVEGFDEKNIALAEAINTSNIKVVTTRDDLCLLREKWISRDGIFTEKVADPAVSLSKYIQPSRLNRQRNFIGLGIGRKGLFEEYGVIFSETQIKELWVSLYEILVGRGYKCVLFTNGHPADYEFAQEVLKEIHKAGYEDALCLDKPKTVQDLVDIISSFDGMIVTRLHASIIGFSYDIPSIGLVWNEKQQMFGENIGYPERFINPSEFDASFIANELEKAIAIGYEKINRLNYGNTTEKTLERFINEFMKYDC